MAAEDQEVLQWPHNHGKGQADLLANTVAGKTLTGCEMRIVTAIDSFKGCMTSIEAGMAAAEGIRRVIPDAAVEVRPLADGGEGTVEALVAGMEGETVHVQITGPLGEPVDCVYGLISNAGDPHSEDKGDSISAGDAGSSSVSVDHPAQSATAVIEMSGAAGITLVPEDRLNPLEATTYGVGEVIRDAIRRGCRNFIIGIGGSATNDGGVGMLQALGWSFCKADGNEIPHGARGLKSLQYIDDRNVIPELSECTFHVACDVNNPLCGENGCSAVFGPQKGATPDVVRKMDAWMAHYADVAAEYCKASADPSVPGAGAAGGLGYAFLAFLNGELAPGIEIVEKATRLEHFIQKADLVITGEGRLDFQTSMGKAPIGVAELSKKYHKPVIAFAGSVTRDASACNEKGIDAFFPIIRKPGTLQEAMNPVEAKRNMADTAEQAIRLFLLGISAQPEMLH